MRCAEYVHSTQSRPTIRYKQTPKYTPILPETNQPRQLCLSISKKDHPLLDDPIKDDPHKCRASIQPSFHHEQRLYQKQTSSIFFHCQKKRLKACLYSPNPDANHHNKLDKRKAAEPAKGRWLDQSLGFWVGGYGGYT